MIKKIVISYFNSVAAILQNNRIQEIIINNDDYQVNDIYIGTVHKIFSSINAAFIKLGKYRKSGFIHISDTKPLIRNRKLSYISDVLSINQVVLVQIIKEPTSSKGPRLTANIHLHGKYIVLMPFCNTILISNRVYDSNERLHLYSLAVLIKPKLMGIIIKSSSEGASESAILKDLESLIKQWYFIQKVFILNSNPVLIYKDDDLIKKIIRDFYENSTQKIIIDSEHGLKLIYFYLQEWSCLSFPMKTKLQLYNSQFCILDKFFVKRAIKEALRPKVTLKCGGYIIIENYEALTIIDVNSGSFNKLNNSRETIIKINFYAAIEIAHQLKIRNLNGVIIIDFIDMDYQRDQLKLLEHFNKLLILDDAKPQIVQLSELGLIELTRKRKGQSLREVFGSTIKHKSDNFSFFPANRVYFKLFFKISRQYLKYGSLVNKNIRSLFFNKNFSNNKLLESKCFFSNRLVYRKYFVCIDNTYPIYLFNPKANYLVPLVFYYSLVKYKKHIG
uniref:Ribonuclease E n=1 Tax=Digenea simplex TaxID=945030 RepID=A0A1Z1MUP5_DIGSM|nr:ribonuclease E [Digenea simplex]ARW69455.1 ribonuclease E [Digenea simplex]